MDSDIQSSCMIRLLPHYEVTDSRYEIIIYSNGCNYKNGYLPFYSNARMTSLHLSVIFDEKRVVIGESANELLTLVKFLILHVSEIFREYDDIYICLDDKAIVISPIERGGLLCEEVLYMWRLLSLILNDMLPNEDSKLLALVSLQVTIKLHRDMQTAISAESIKLY